jgi:hypothetical protein
VPLLEVPLKWRPGLFLQDGLTFTQELRDTLAEMIETMNKGIATLPDLRKPKALL